MSKMEKIRGMPHYAVYDEIESPVGRLTLIASSEGLHAILWEGERISGLKPSKDQPVIAQTKTQLDEYFQGKRRSFDLPLVMQGTSFQVHAWRELLKIPYGTTVSYGEQAEKMGDKNKARAVGMANGRNPLSIVVPCHRVIGSGGRLVGFGGGLEKKAYLLNLEKKNGLALG